MNISNSIYIVVTAASSTEVPPSTWEKNIGLLSSLIPNDSDRSQNTTTLSPVVPSPIAYNTARGALKLGMAPLQDNLAEETKRAMKEDQDFDATMADGADGAMSAKARRAAAANEPILVAPSASDLPPRPILFKSIDVKREVEKIRDVRKRIRLEPASLTAADAELGLDRPALFAKAGAMPSICAYTFHDAVEG